MENKNESKIEEMEIVISNFLRIGVILSAVVVFIGLLMFLITKTVDIAGVISLLLHQKYLGD